MTNEAIQLTIQTVTPMVWYKLSEYLPPEGVPVLTDMKHGLIQGVYDSEEECFTGYYWSDMQWYSGRWMYVPE